MEKATSFLGVAKVVGMRERGETRLANQYDPVAALDSSAQVSYDPDWWKNFAKGGGHDYHRTASQYQGFKGDGSGLNHGDRPPGIDMSYRSLDNTTKTSWNNPDGSTSLAR